MVAFIKGTGRLRYVWIYCVLGIILAICATLLFAVADKPLPTLAVFPQMKNAQILSTQHGLWVACYGQGIWHQQGETWELVEIDDPDDHYIVCMTPGPDNQIYAAPWMGDGLLEIDQTTLAVQVIPWPMDLPQWNRDYARPKTILANGRSVLIATRAGMISYHIDSKQWLLQNDETIGYSRFTPDDDGYWQLGHQTLMHQNTEDVPTLP